MAAGNTYGFVVWLQRVFEYFEHDFGTTPNTIKCALIKSAANGGADPSVTDAYPTWGSGGTTDYSAHEVTPGGNYAAGGVTCATPGATVVSNALQLDWSNPPVWVQHASNPTNARWAIFYDDTSPNKDCIAWYDLGADVNMINGDLTLTMGAPAYTITVATP
jgi:hypothetical protein